MSSRYLLAVLSNQGGISLRPDPKTVKSDQKRLADFKGKVSTVLSQLDLPVTVYAATGRDEYRKPRVGMWRELLEDYDLERAEMIDLEKSFFIGDAGGREAVAGLTVKDHSCVDRYVSRHKKCIVTKECIVLRLHQGLRSQRRLTVPYARRVLPATDSSTICEGFRSNHLREKADRKLNICKYVEGSAATRAIVL